MREGGVTGEFSPVEGVVAYRVEGDARRRGRLPPPRKPSVDLNKMRTN